MYDETIAYSVKSAGFKTTDFQSMAEQNDQDPDQKTEDPSHKRLEHAKEKGQAPSSKEMVGWFFIASCAIVLIWILPIFAHHLALHLRSFLSHPHQMDLSIPGAAVILQHLIQKTALELSFPLLTIVIIIVGMGILILKDSISLSVLTPKLERLSLKKGIQKIFSSKALIEFLKTILKATVLFVCLYFLFKDHIKEIQQWTHLSIRHLYVITENLIFKLFVFVLIFLFFIAGGDYFYQRWKFLKDLRMTKQEVKEEYKETQGDPMIKQRIRQIRADRARNKMMQKIPDATVVITNPTHYSVALFFDEQTSYAPKVVAKGQDHMALLIREIAKRHQVPIVENPPVARDLYARVDLDQDIPEDTYQAVAEIIRFVLTLKQKRF